MVKMDAKEIGLTVLLGSAVVIGTPMVAGLLGGVGFMATEIIPGTLSIGTAVSAGISAFIADLAITKWLR